MRLFSVACRAAEQKMADLFTGELRVRERLELEAHADGCGRCGTALRDLAAISVALDRAYAPMRQRGTALSPARARLAARIPPQPSVAWWRIGFVGRLSEATMALGFAALIVGGAMDLAATRPGAMPSTPASVIQDYFRAQPPAEETAYARWLRWHATAADFGPALGYPLGGESAAQQISDQNDWLSIGAPR
jgi:anti-sigma factor RsiW